MTLITVAIQGARGCGLPLEVPLAASRLQMTFKVSAAVGDTTFSVNCTIYHLSFLTASFLAFFFSGQRMPNLSDYLPLFFCLPVKTHCQDDFIWGLRPDSCKIVAENSTFPRDGASTRRFVWQWHVFISSVGFRAARPLRGSWVFCLSFGK